LSSAAIQIIKKSQYAISFNEEQKMPEYTINMTWDNEAAVWYAVCDDIPIALESGSFDALIERVKIATPELLVLNGNKAECRLHFVADRKDEVA